MANKKTTTMVVPIPLRDELRKEAKKRPLSAGRHPALWEIVYLRGERIKQLEQELEQAKQGK